MPIVRLSRPASTTPRLSGVHLTTRVDPTSKRVFRAVGNMLGAGFAVYLLRPNLEFFIHTHRTIGLVFVAQRTWVAVLFLVRRAPRTVSTRIGDWIAAYAGWFTSFLIRPTGAHLPWGVFLGFWVQMAGLIVWTWALWKLARSFGVVAADRGLVTDGPYRIVRHPLYAAYMIGGLGYLLQSISIWNVTVDVIAVAWQIVRIKAEERHLSSTAYQAYKAQVRCRLVPALW